MQTFLDWHEYCMTQHFHNSLPGSTSQLAAIIMPITLPAPSYINTVVSHFGWLVIALFTCGFRNRMPLPLVYAKDRRIRLDPLRSAFPRYIMYSFQPVSPPQFPLRRQFRPFSTKAQKGNGLCQLDARTLRTVIYLVKKESV